MIGRAVDSLATLEPSPPFDLVFIDADKPSNLDYFIHAKRLLRPGGVIVSTLVFLALYYRFLQFVIRIPANACGPLQGGPDHFDYRLLTILIILGC